MSNRNLIICSDGTGNTFDKSISNVTRLIRLLGLHNHESQIVMYDQGIGTNAKRLRDVRDHANSIPDRNALVVLDGPRDWWFSPSGLTVRVLGLLAGFGLKDKVREMYYQLSQLYEGRNDNVFLFGFSRGAFTVRALAGLIYRCGLPRRDVTDFKACFEEFWYLYQPHVEPGAAVKDFRTRYGQRDCKIHFLGIWDTVKSYGGLRPISLPHLRHNPIVGTVRHALGLDERRSWFNATTWGQLDLDENGAKTRLKKEDLPKYLSQDIEEVWFRGCHSDVGGGDVEECTAKIALRWMLGEAVAAGLRLNEDGRLSLMTDDPTWPPVIDESLRGFWWLTEYLPRQEIDNSGEYPVKKWKPGRTGVRKPHELTRQQHWSLHTTARAAIKYVDTKTLGDGRGDCEVDRALK